MLLLLMYKQQFTVVSALAGGIVLNNIWVFESVERDWTHL